MVDCIEGLSVHAAGQLRHCSGLGLRMTLVLTKVDRLVT